MRYQNFGAFKKHLASAAPDHLSRCYLVAIPDDYERGLAIQAFVSHVSDRPCISLNGASASFQELWDALASPSLWGNPVVFLDEAEKVEKKKLQMLIDFVQGSSFLGYFFCTVKSKTSLSSLFEKVGVVFDLTEEKPWEKEKRLAVQITERAQRGGKRLAFDATELLFERLGCNLALLDTEVDKLICFTGTRPTIERSDVFRISASNPESREWRIAEDLIWEGQSLKVAPDSFHGLIAALRSQLQIGLKLVELIASKTPPEEWRAHLPRLWPKLLEKRGSQASRLGSLFFQKGLRLLFEIELLSRTRSGGVDRERALLDFFQMAVYASR